MDTSLSYSEIDYSKKYKKICQAAIRFFASVYNFKPLNEIVTACHKLYLKKQGYTEKEIRFILMIHAAIMRGFIQRETRRCQKR